MRVRWTRGVLWWIAQAAASLVVCVLLTSAMWLSTKLYAALAWAAIPLWGLWSAYFVARRGVNNYVAWIAPPVCAFLSHYIVTGFAPTGAGPTLLTAFLSIVGAAAGLVAGGRAKKQ